MSFYIVSIFRKFSFHFSIAIEKGVDIIASLGTL